MSPIIGRDKAYEELQRLSGIVEAEDGKVRSAKERMMHAIMEIREGKWVDEQTEEVIEGLWRVEGETFRTFEEWLDGMEAEAGVSLAGSTAWDKVRIIKDLEAMFPDMTRETSVQMAVHHQGASKSVINHFNEMPEEVRENPDRLIETILAQPNSKKSKSVVNDTLGKRGRLWFSFIKKANTGELSFKPADRHVALEVVYDDTPYQVALVFEDDIPDQAVRMITEKLSKRAEV